MRIALSTTQKLVIGFLAVILGGGALLALPISHAPGARLSAIDAWFLSVSAVCVTGLSPVVIADTLSVFGKIVLAILIQTGGLGYATFAIFLSVLFGGDIPFRQRDLAQESLNQANSKGIITLVKVVMLSSLIVEAIGTIILAWAFRTQAGSPREALGLGLFHAISAFNNAGFDLFGDSLMEWHDNLLVNMTVSLLIITGGIGFVVIADMLQAKRWKRFSLHSKIVISTTGVLLVGGMLLIHATSSLSWLESWFLSVTSRTAGFNSVDTATLNRNVLLVVLFLMWIGASPGSTGGGIKTTTFFTLLCGIRGVVTHTEPVGFERKISDDSLAKATAVAGLSALALALGIFLLSLSQHATNLFGLVFEAVSAFATVGLSTGVTGTLATGGKIILMVLMFIGRLGPVTIASSLQKQEARHVHYVPETIIIG